MAQTLPIDTADRLYHLNTGIIGTGALRHERPHKPCLLLAVCDLMAMGQATPERIEWSRQLMDRFAAYFEVVRASDDKNTPENPFFYLRSEGFWQPLRVNGSGRLEPLQKPPLRGDAGTGRVFARFDPAFANLLNPTQREAVRRQLVSRYFPGHAVALRKRFQDRPEAQPGLLEESPQAPYPGRSSAFRNFVTELYDFQCAACGLRIRIQPGDITFVDAAHIVPFSLSSNDHPSNGLALCKNHHWAMDQRLIAPHPERYWTASPLLDKRRSAGEAALLQLTGQALLTPKESAYAPSREALQWRSERLLA